MLSHLSKETLHHAYFFEGRRSAVVPKLLEFVTKDLGIETVGNPDFWMGEYESFGIDDARYVNALQAQKPVDNAPRIFILSFSFIAHEAQNALLKMFEEPTSNTHFFITAPSVAVLLPTLKSRLIIETIGGQIGEGQSLAQQFLKAPTAERLKIIQPFTVHDEGANKEETIAFVSDLEIALHELLKKDTSYATSLSQLLKLKQYLFDRSSSVKMIIEYLALTLPKA